MRENSVKLLITGGAGFIDSAVIRHIINNIYKHNLYNQLSKELGIILGKINNFKNSKHKIQYSCLLTPKGIEEKTKLTIEFLKAKTKEY